MKSFQDISDYIEIQTSEIEESFDLGDLTVKYGLQSFRYGTSDYLDDLFNVLQLNEKTVFYDLGSGYGKVILYGAYHYPKVQFKGIEIIEERNKICNTLIDKLQLKNIKTYCTDFFEVDFSDGDVFYIFNPLYEPMYEKLIQKLHSIALVKPITIVAESKCDVFDTISWLSNEKSIYDAIDIRKKLKFYTSIL
ncbi:MAG: hypothetical protein JKY02_09820 [Flavobacteriaceae bacterium]|nr:hypothetical protein [Flavobacteriaceae bacterium]